MEQQKTFDNTGSLFINEKKVSEKHPDYKGSITINGQKYWLSGWLRLNDKKDGSGKVQYISISAEAAEQKQAAPVGFPTAGSGMLRTAASLSTNASQAPAPRRAPAPAPAPVADEEGKDDLPF